MHFLQTRAQLYSSDVQLVCDALVSLSYECADHPWLEQEVRRLLDHPDPRVRRVASVCHGYTFGPVET